SEGERQGHHGDGHDGSGSDGVVLHVVARRLGLATDLAQLGFDVAACDRASFADFLRRAHEASFRLPARVIAMPAIDAQPTSTIRYGAHDQLPWNVVPVSFCRARSPP